MSRYSILLCTLLLYECGGDVRRPEWNLRFESEALRARVFATEVRIRRGGCSGARIAFEDVLVPGTPGRAPPRLSPGRVGFEARGASSLCRYVAEGCVEVDLPTSDPIDVLLRESDDAPRCEADRCMMGLCEGIDFGDGRAPLPPRSIAPGNGERAPSPLRFAWASVAGAERYEVSIVPCLGAVASCSFESVATLTVRAERTELLEPGRYAWHVRACNESGCSGPGQTRHVTIGAHNDLAGDAVGDLLVGAPTEPNGLIPNAGAAYAYDDVEDGRPAMARLVSVVEEGSGHGSALTAADVDGDGTLEAFVSAPFADLGTVDTGQVYVFPGARTLRSLEARASAAFGQSIAHCDIDADGFDDLIIGAAGRDDGRGRVEVRFGDAESRLDRNWVLSGASQAGARFGETVACADVDADGLGEVIVAAPGEDRPGAPGLGVVYVFDDQGPATVIWTQPEREAGAGFGRALAGLGDIDGDGIDEVAVGAPGALSGGRAYLFRGQLGSAVGAPETIANPGLVGDAFGAALSGGGDVDGDGARDYVIGAPGSDAAYLYLGAEAPTELVLTHVQRFDTPMAGIGFGAAVTLIDLDADLLADLVVGAPEGNSVYLYFGGRIPVLLDLMITGPVAGGRFGAIFAR